MQKFRITSSVALSLIALIAGNMAAHAQDAPVAPTTPATQPPAQTPTQPTGTLSVSILIVDDLVPRPVPFTDFLIRLADKDDTSVSSAKLRTDEKGLIAVNLPAGKYVIESIRPLDFKGKQLSWSYPFTVESGKPTTLKLTDADAKISVQASTPSREIGGEGQIYKEAKDSVVTVEGDFGRGSGFIISTDGLVVTNAHVVDKTDWVALRFHPGLRVRAMLVAEDRDADVAIVRFNPASVPFALHPLKMADPAPGTELATVGEKVLAIGNPLNQETVLTTGIISQMNNGVLISDVNINHGNSGGPLLNMSGEVIGITTFGDFTRQGGPGISGIVAITKAVPVIGVAQKKVGADNLPAADALPDISPITVPNEDLASADDKHNSPINTSTSHHFDAIIYTPLTLAALRNDYDRELSCKRRDRVKKRDNDGKDTGDTTNANPFWARTALHTQDAFVLIDIRPSLQETSGSKWASVMGALGNVPTKRVLEYRDDFYDFQLLSGDKLIEPIRRGRVKLEQMFDGYFLEVHDTAYGGEYLYDPAAFNPESPLVLRMRRASDLTDWMTFKISSKEQQKIWDSFAGYRARLAQSTVAPNAVETTATVTVAK